MDGILSFLSDLILLTAGLAVVTFWFIIFVVIAIEIIDLFKDAKNPAEDEEPI